MTNPLQSKSPVEIDTDLAEAYIQLARLDAVAEHANHELKRADEFWGDPEIAAKHADSDPQGIIDRAKAALDAAVGAYQDHQTTVVFPLEDEFTRRGGWARYYLVVNSNGHVHSSKHCTTCFPTTRYGWLTQFSAATVETIVAEFGETACTICFPDAPVFKGFEDGTSALARYSEAEKAERATAKNERAAAKAAKQLAEPVSFKHGGYTERIETIYAAKQWIKQAIDYDIAYGYHTYQTSETEAAIAALTAALEARDVDVAPLVAKWTKAAQKLAHR